MQSFAKHIQPWHILGLGVISLLLLALACGSAAPAAPQVVEKEVIVEREVIKEVVVEKVMVATPTPAAKPPASAVNPGKLTIMVATLASERFDSAFVGGATGAHSYGRIVHGFLISTTDKREFAPGIAKKWGLSADGLAWTFTIGDGAKFHDGSDVTPEDVLWTLRHFFGPHAAEFLLSSDFARVSKVVTSIELSEPDVVTITTDKPQTDIGDLLSEAGPQWYGHVLPKRAKLHDLEDEQAYDKNPIGAGPLKLEKHVPGFLMRFERFDDFYYQPKNGFSEDRRMNFQSLDLLLVPEEATRVAAVRAGEADIVPASLPQKKQVEAGGGRLVFGQEGGVVEVRMQGCFEAQFPCNDKRVRQALNYAIDKELIRDELYGGTQVFETKGWLAVTPSTAGYTPELDPFPFDPDKARQLLAEAGYPGGQGFGKLILNTHSSTAMPFQIESAQIGAEFWKRELGLDVEVKVGEWTALKKDRNAGRLNGQVLWRDNETRRDASSAVANAYASPESIRRAHDDPELLSLVNDTFRIVDPDKRAEASKALYVRLRDESYWIAIGYVNIPWGVGPRVLTWRPYPLASFPTALHTITLK